MRIAPGDTVITRTKDASNDLFSVTDKTVFPTLDLTAVNPQTGPFYVEGAEPGDTLVGFDKLDANQLLGQAARLKIANVVDPNYSVACQVAKRYLSR